MEESFKFSGGEFWMEVGWDPEEMRGIISRHTILV
jgi:hypothetical protein